LVSNMQIDLVIETWPPEINGVANSAARFARGLVERGHRVGVIRPRQACDDSTQAQAAVAGVDEQLVSGVSLPRYPELKLGLPAHAVLRRRWQACRPQVVHIATEGPLGWSALRVAKALGLPVATDFRTNFDAYSAHYGLGWLRTPIARWLRWFHNASDVTLVPTEAMRERLTAQGVSHVQVVSRGVDTVLFNPARRDEALRKRWGVGPEGLVAAYVGRLAPEKNPQLLVRAFEAIWAVRPDAQLVLVGDGPYRETLLQALPQAVFAGHRRGEDLAAHYASADLFLFPSVTETFGNVVTEAMASGLAIAAFDDAAAAEHLVHGQSGMLAEVGDTEGFVRHAHTLAAQAAMRTRIGARAHERAQRLAWDRVVADLETQLAELAARGNALNRGRRGPAVSMG
jgi:glycosyltransferase involved in cell wall biosynthesis